MKNSGKDKKDAVVKKEKRGSLFFRQWGYSLVRSLWFWGWTIAFIIAIINWLVTHDVPNPDRAYDILVTKEITWMVIGVIVIKLLIG